MSVEPELPVRLLTKNTFLVVYLSAALKQSQRRRTSCPPSFFKHAFAVEPQQHVLAKTGDDECAGIEPVVDGDVEMRSRSTSACLDADHDWWSRDESTGGATVPEASGSVSVQRSRSDSLDKCADGGIDKAPLAALYVSSLLNLKLRTPVSELDMRAAELEAATDQTYAAARALEAAAVPRAQGDRSSMLHPDQLRDPILSLPPASTSTSAAHGHTDNTHAADGCTDKPRTDEVCTDKPCAVDGCRENPPAPEVPLMQDMQREDDQSVTVDEDDDGHSHAWKPARELYTRNDA